MTSQVSLTTPLNNDPEISMERKRKEGHPHDDSEYTQKKTRKNWNQFQTLKLIELLTTEFPNDTSGTILKQEKIKHSFEKI